MKLSSIISEFCAWEDPAQPMWKQFCFFLACAVVLVGIFGELAFFLYVFG